MSALPPSKSNGSGFPRSSGRLPVTRSRHPMQFSILGPPRSGESTQTPDSRLRTASWRAGFSTGAGPARTPLHPLGWRSARSRPLHLPTAHFHSGSGSRAPGCRGPESTTFPFRSKPALKPVVPTLWVRLENASKNSVNPRIFRPLRTICVWFRSTFHTWKSSPRAA